MDKQDIKVLCEHDDQLQWWAIVLFAEVVELANAHKNGGCDHETVGRMVVGKADEWDRIVLHHTIKLARKALESQEAKEEPERESVT